MSNNENKSTKKKGKLGRLLSQRKFRYGGYAVILTAVVIAVVILLNVALGAIESNWALSFDVTAMNATDFSDATVEIVKNVDQDVHVYTLFQSSTTNSTRVQVDSVLEKYHALNGKITLDNIDPVKEPARVTEFAGDTNLSEGAVIVTNADKSRVKLINRSDYYRYANYGNSYSYTIFDLEAKLSNALVYVTSVDTPHVYFLTGHNEPALENSFTILTNDLQSRNYDVSALNLSSDDVTLESGDTVVVIDPALDLEEDEYNAMREWLAAGGRLLISLSYNVDTAKLPNFVKLLDYYQLSYGDGVVYENENSTGNYAPAGGTLYLIPNMDEEHKITADLVTNKNVLVLPQARPINDIALPESGFEYTKLLTTSSRAVVTNGSETSVPGTQILALSLLKQNSADPSKDIRIVQLGCPYLMLDTQLLYSTYNREFMVKAFDWLVNSESTIDIPTKYVADSVLSVPDAATSNTLGIIVVIAIPLIVLVAGIVVYLKRRRL